MIITNALKEQDKPDKSLLQIQKKIEYNNILDEDVPNGRFVIQYNNVDFDCFYFHRNCKKLYVLLNGSRPVGTSPVFKRWSWYTFMDGSVLNIDDPMCRDFPNLMLGWYWGSSNRSYRHDVVEIVKKFAEKNEFSDIVFYASSGGGTAAIHCSILYEGSSAVVINPQLKVSLYEQADRFQKITGINLLDDDEFQREELMENLKQSKSKFIFCENAISNTDRKQTEYLMESFGIKECQCGLNCLSNNVVLWIYEAEGPRAHDNQEWKTMFMAIENLRKMLRDNENLEEIFKWYELFSEFWKERYNQINLLSKKRREVKTICAPLVCEDSSERKFYSSMLKIEAKSDEYNHLIIQCDLEQCTGYVLRIDSIVVSNSEDANVKATVAIKDVLYNTILFSEKITGAYKLFFFTGEDVSKIELRIYPGEIGRCKNRQITVYGVSVFKV